MDLLTFNESFLDQHSAQPEARTAAAEMLALLAPERTSDAIQTIASNEPSTLALDQVPSSHPLSVASSSMSPPNHPLLPQASEALAALSRLGDVAAVSQFKAKALSVFELAAVFAH